jgi:hypothetical protein
MTDANEGAGYARAMVDVLRSAATVSAHESNRIWLYNNKAQSQAIQRKQGPQRPSAQTPNEKLQQRHQNRETRTKESRQVRCILSSSLSALS